MNKNIAVLMLIQNTRNFKEQISNRFSQNCRVWKIVLVGLALVALPACERVERHHGHSISSKSYNFQVGRTTKENVTQCLGSPSSILSYDPNTLYYLNQKVMNQALFKSAFISSNSVAFVFSQSGILSRIIRSNSPYSISICRDSIPLPSKHKEGFWKQAIRSFEESNPATTISPF